MKKSIAATVFMMVVGLSGYGILILIDWRIAVGVFLVVWFANYEMRSHIKKQIDGLIDDANDAWMS